MKLRPSGHVLVTGAGGMLGRSLVAKLVDDGVAVRAMLGPEDSPHVLSRGVELAVAEVTDPDELAAVMPGITAVVHLAGPPSVADSFRAPSLFARVHTVGTAQLLEACRNAEVTRFCYVSSAEVYGTPDDNPVPETASTRPRSPYGAAKLGAEWLARSICPAAEIELVVLRPFSVYGSDSPPWSLLGTIMRQATSDAEIRLAALSPIRDFVHVADVAEALARAISVPVASPLVVNVGTGVGSSVGSVAQLALEVVGRKVPILESHTVKERRGGQDVVQLVSDTRESASKLGWTASMSLRDGLVQAVGWR